MDAESNQSFYIKPRLDADFLKWTWAFKKSATTAKVEKAIPVIKDINILSRDLYEGIKASNAFNFHYERKGLLMCYQTDKVGEAEWEVGKRGIEEGLHVKNLTKKEVAVLEPNANLDIKGAVYFDSDAHMTPTDFMPEMIAYLKAKGVVFYANETVKDIEVSNGTISKIKTDKQMLKADEVVLAAGSWSPLLTKKIAVTPMQGFTRFAGTMEIAGINHQINPLRVQTIADAAAKYYGNLKITDAEQKAADCGLRPCSPDGLPYIGKSSKCTNLTIATGHAMMGWSLGPATGKLVSEIISDKKTSLNLNPFHPDRSF